MIPARRNASQFPPRGVQLNNPGLIRIGPDTWTGQSNSQGDSEFVTFVTVAYGVRAMFRLLDAYSRIHQVDSTRDIINRWAPPSENVTSNYVDFVVSRTMLPADHRWIKGADLLSRSFHRVPLVEAIAIYENGWRLESSEILEGLRALS